MRLLPPKYRFLSCPAYISFSYSNPQHAGVGSRFVDILKIGNLVLDIVTRLTKINPNPTPARHTYIHMYIYLLMAVSMATSENRHKNYLFSSHPEWKTRSKWINDDFTRNALVNFSEINYLTAKKRSYVCIASCPTADGCTILLRKMFNLCKT
jgi:hypothetical protein